MLWIKGLEKEVCDLYIGSPTKALEEDQRLAQVACLWSDFRRRGEAPVLEHPYALLGLATLKRLD